MNCFYSMSQSPIKLAPQVPVKLVIGTLPEIKLLTVCDSPTIIGGKHCRVLSIISSLTAFYSKSVLGCTDAGDCVPST